MKNAIYLLLSVAFMLLVSPVTSAADLEFKQEKYDAARIIDRDLYEIATKGFRGVLVGSSKEVVVDNGFLGLSRAEVITKLGNPAYNKGDTLMYFTVSKYDPFQVIAMKFNKRDQVICMVFPVLNDAGMGYTSKTKIAELLGPATTRKTDRMTYISDDGKKMVTFTWKGFLDKRCSSVVIGNVTKSDLGKLFSTNSKAKERLAEYRLDVTLEELGETLKGMEDQSREERRKKV